MTRARDGAVLRAHGRTVERRLLATRRLIYHHIGSVVVLIEKKPI